MQNVDFSRMIRQRPAERVDDNNFNPAIQQRRTSNRAYVTAFILALLAFALGVLAGLRLGDRLDKNMVVYPDKSAQKFANKPEEVNENTAPAASASGAGKYLIKLGTFTPGEADKLTEQLNGLSSLDGLKVDDCRQVELKRRPGELAFTIPLKTGVPRSNVFLGCFSSRDLAVGTVEIVTSSGLPGTSQAKLYEIE